MPAAWRGVLAACVADLGRLGATDDERRTFAADAGAFIAWIAPTGLTPQAVPSPILLRYAHALRVRGLGPAAVSARLHAARRLVAAAGVARAARRPARAGAPGGWEALLDALPAATPLEVRDRALAALAWGGRLRPEEVAGADLAGVGPGATRLDAGRPQRRVELDGRASEALRRWVEQARDVLAGPEAGDALFVSRSGRRLTAGDARRRLRACERVGADAVATNPRSAAVVVGHQICTASLDCRVESERLKVAYQHSHPRA